MALSKDETIWLENYKLLMDLIGYESKNYWDRYNVFLALNSGLLAALVLLGSRSPIMKLPLVGISFFGMIQGIAWFLVVARASAYLRHWIKTAREIEENKLQQLTIFKKEEEFRSRLNGYEKAPIMKTVLVIPVLASALWFLLTLWVLIFMN